MSTVPYAYLRALELEGRHPQDAGAWYLTIGRLQVGEGLPVHPPWSKVEVGDDDRFPATTPPPPNAIGRSFYYKRVRSASECERFLSLGPATDVRLSCSLTASWANSPGGVLPAPSPSDPPIGKTHSTMIHRWPGSRQSRQFRFANTWGAGWGDRGFGYMPFSFFDRYVFEAWADYPNPEALRGHQCKPLDRPGHVRWTARDEVDHRINIFQICDDKHEIRKAWAFVVERDGALEIEEVYVRPEFRGQGHGRWLVERLKELGGVKKMPLRLRVGFADCRRESEANFPALVATARRMGVRFQPCPVPWAAYFGTNDGPGETNPVEPDQIPERPRSTMAEVFLAASLALGAGDGNGALKTAQTIGSRHADEDAIVLGSREWEALTDRRAELIMKKNRSGLTQEEWAEFKRLEAQSEATIRGAFPPDLSLSAKLDAIEDRLRTAGSPSPK
jgi:GNAT superfamily N-acetyltransferase